MAQSDKYWVANNPNSEVTNAEAIRIASSHRLVIRQTAATDWNDAAYSLTTAQSGALILFDKDEITTVTLPAITATDIGVTYEFMETVASDTLRKIVTAYDNDYLIGGVTNLLDATGDTDGLITFVSTGTTDTIISLDDDLDNCGGAVGARVVLTAVLTGNTEAGGGSKFVWAVSGNMVAKEIADTGAAFFS